jgi:hypothetical protein
MPRSRQRVCLQDGLKLDINNLAHRGFIRRGAKSDPIGIRWYSSYWDKDIASGFITADMSGVYEGWLRIQLGNLDQSIMLVAYSRRFGGRQWYFMCPAMNRPVSVLWKPPGATRFCSRQEWGHRVVAYRSQFLDPDNRAHAGQAKIKSRLIGDCDPDEWDLPPKPKWMRWRTYNRYVQRYDRYEDILEEGIIPLMAKLLGRSGLEDWPAGAESKSGLD